MFNVDTVEDFKILWPGPGVKVFLMLGKIFYFGISV